MLPTNNHFILISRQQFICNFGATLGTAWDAGAIQLCIIRNITDWITCCTWNSNWALEHVPLWNPLHSFWKAADWVLYLCMLSYLPQEYKLTWLTWQNHYFLVLVWPGAWLCLQDWRSVQSISANQLWLPSLGGKQLCWQLFDAFLH